MDNNNNNINNNDIIHNNVNINGQPPMIEETAMVNSGQSSNNYCSMVNVVSTEQPTNNDFFNYYFNANNNNPQATSNMLQQQQHAAYLDEQTGTLHDVQQQQQQHIPPNIPANLAQPPMHHSRYMFIDPTNDHHHQPPSQLGSHNHNMAGITTNTKIEHSPFIQPPYNNAGAPNNSTMFDTPRNNNSRNSQVRLNYMDNQQAQYMAANNGGGGPSSVSPKNNNNHHLNNAPQNNPMLNTPFPSYVVTFPNQQPVAIGQMPGVYSKASPATVLWLLENYESAEGVSLPRCLLYSHYIYHCKDLDSNPVNSASFGKLIRSLFPNLKTRRLGTRGKSKYHYYGIRIRDNSVLHTFGRSEDEVIDFLSAENEPFLRKILPQHPSLLKSMSSQSGSDLSITTNSDISSTTAHTGYTPPPNSARVHHQSSLHSDANQRNRAQPQLYEEDESVISISLKNDLDTSSPGSGDTSTNSSTGDSCFFSIEQFEKYFPDERKFPFGMAITQDYPTRKSFQVDVEPLFSDTEYDNFKLSPPNSNKAGPSIRTNPVCRLKHYLKYSASKMMPLIPQLDTALFLQQTEENLKHLSRLVDNGADEQSQSSAVYSPFDCEDILQVNKDLDLLVYQFLVHRLFPKIFSYYPSNYICCIRAFARKLVETVEHSCASFPEKFRNSKIRNVKAFGSIIRHYTCLSHIYTGAVNSLQGDKQMKLATEITKLDIEELFQQHDMVYQVCADKNIYNDAMKELVLMLNTSMDEVPPNTQSQLQSQSVEVVESKTTTDDLDIITTRTNRVSKRSIDSLNSHSPPASANISSLDSRGDNKKFKAQRIIDLLGWVSSIKTKFVRHLYNQGHAKPTNGEQYCNIFKKFSAVWNHTMILLVREMTLQGSSAFGLIHILHLLFFEFIPHMIQQDLFDTFDILPIHYYIKA